MVEAEMVADGMDSAMVFGGDRRDVLKVERKRRGFEALGLVRCRGGGCYGLDETQRSEFWLKPRGLMPCWERSMQT